MRKHTDINGTSNTCSRHQQLRRQGQQSQSQQQHQLRAWTRLLKRCICVTNVRHTVTTPELYNLRATSTTTQPVNHKIGHRISKSSRGRTTTTGKADYSPYQHQQQQYPCTSAFVYSIDLLHVVASCTLCPNSAAPWHTGSTPPASRALQ